MITLKENEKAEDLQYGGLFVIQSKDEYRFTTDAVVLANFVRDLNGKICVEFGTGSGVIALLVAKKKRPRKLYALEIQPQLADMAARSVKLNGMEDVIDVICGDLKQVSSLVPCAADAVVCNPPYRKRGSGERQEAENIALCRHEIAATLEDVIKSAAEILKNKGSLYLVHQSSRLCEAVCTMNKYNLAVKEILPVCPKPERQPSVVLLRAVKNAASDCILRAPVYVTDRDGNYTSAAKTFRSAAEKDIKE